MLNWKCVLAVMACLMLFSSFAADPIVKVKAPVVTEPIRMSAVISDTDPYWGEYGGYWDVMYAIRDSLKDIGIDLRFETPYFWEDHTAWAYVAKNWNISAWYGYIWTYQPYAGGWDFTVREWRQNPTSYIWLDSLVYSWATPPVGRNVMSWTDYKADYYYKRAQTTLDPVAHKNYMMLWQAEFMHNPPVIPLYYADMMTARAAYLDGYDDTAWLYELSQIDINETLFDQVAPLARKGIGNNTLIYAAAEPIWSLFPFYTLTRTEEAMNVLKQGILYRTSRENLKFPTSGNYTVVPTLAADFPTWLDGSNGPKTVARVPLRQGITWTDGVPFNSTDVAFTFNTLLKESAYTSSYADYSFLIQEVRVVDEYTVDFIFKAGMAPDYDFAGYLAHGWGLSMLPWHQLKDIPPTSWKLGTFATDPIPVSRGGTGLECLGPYVPVEWNSSTGYVKLQKRTEYVNALGWSNTLPEYFAVKVISNAASRLVALQNLEVDFVDYPTAPVETWQSMITWPTHKVYTFSYPASHTLWMNPINPILSNRYVRLAIAYAIPYPKIYNEILPSWGVAVARPGKTFVTPLQDSFDTALGNYTYNITRAQQYMNMWYYSQAGMQPYTNGPMGDHDFSGYVEIADFPIWARWFGTSPTTDPNYPYPDKWPHTPGNDIDPDNDNSGYVEMRDFPLWASNFGKSYPFLGAW